MLIKREELIKKIEETDTSEIIENEMNFKFKDLELIGMHRNRYDEILYYKNDEKIYVIKIINGYIYIQLIFYLRRIQKNVILIL